MFQGERFISSDFLEIGRSDSFFVVLKEQLVGAFNPLADILYGLRSNLLPERFTLSNFGNMTLKFAAIQVLAPHSVVPFVKCDAIVVDHPGDVDTSLEISVLLALIYLELQCFHTNYDIIMGSK